MFKKASIAILISTSLIAQEIHVEVQDPLQREGEIFTEKGGVITANHLRIQAKNLSLKEIDGEKIVTAEKDLLIVYGNKFLIGDRFTYNFTTEKGVLENGVSYTSGIYTGGEKVVFEPDGNLKLEKVFLTTSDNSDYEWSANAKEVNMDPKYQAGADKVTLSIYQMPVFWAPSFSTNLKPKHKEDPTVRYRVMWEKGQGPLFLVRYKALDTDNLKIHLRGEYRVKPDSESKVKQGVGGALELDYLSSEKRQKLASRTFYAYETFYNDNNPRRLKQRYRIQGVYSGESKDKRLETFCRWDKLSDKNMRQDFPTQLFELQTLERTEAYVKGKFDPVFTSLYGRPRINDFRGFVQELPTFKAAFKSFELGKTGVVLENYFKFAFLDYAYASNLNNLVKNFHAGRLETKQGLYRNFQFGPLSLTPKVGVEGIYYTNNPQGQEINQAVLTYNLDARSSFYKIFDRFSHHIEPYATFQGMERPLAKHSDVYIFSIQDGFHELKELKLGLKNAFFKDALFSETPRFFFDVAALSFYNTDTFTVPVPKAHLNFGWNFSRASFTTKLGYNLQENTFDFANFNLASTLNEYFAFSLELRHRGRFDWKKNNHANYLLDVTQSPLALQTSPLSDERTIFLARTELQLAPYWTIQVQNHLGWRPRQPFYHESKVDLYTIISNRWKLRLTYMRAVNTNQFTFGINLI